LAKFFHDVDVRFRISLRLYFVRLHLFIFLGPDDCFFTHLESLLVLGVPSFLLLLSGLPSPVASDFWHTHVLALDNCWCELVF
jgi:hypothetical protein